MDKKISPYQLFAGVFIVPYGSAVLFYLASDAKQDAWISILFYIIPGIVLQLMYIYLFNKNSKKTIVEYLPDIFGKYLGLFLAVIYIVYFAYAAMRILGDFAGLIMVSSMPNSSKLAVSFFLILTACYGVFTGIENLCRGAGLIVPLMLIGLILASILLISTTSIFRFENLQPILENGILFPIIKGWKLIVFPFGEPLMFSMLYPSVNKPEKIKKYVIWAIIILGISLSGLTAIFIAALSVNYATMTQFPLLETLRLIRIGFLDRLDVLIIVTMTLGGFFKMSFFMYASVLGMSKVVKVRETKYFSFPLGIIILIISLFADRSYQQHVSQGLNFAINYIHFPLQIVIPLIAVIITYFKSKGTVTK